MIYQYQALVTRLYDGDTVHLDVDLGFSTWIKGSRYRLARINAPELRTAEGKAALAFLETLIQPGDTVTIATLRDQRDDYGRMLVEITTAAGVDVNQVMLDTGHAVPYP